ncbi:uncharacterized protein ATNIH1004_006149 [Aspergillus tanneri]|uniref:Uncharacterized protein n=1 Tax=Aspergillus tanneri TaxID=1220188 RepID=A0A5M9MNF4_9EURO|nr:uncharacterized protein ATNIH1004_006149 [Aspergillus tanneri]KAA8647456.1 hypothetical protein ATNIH1004_006149 [Aspergillus tanneri]
MPGGPWPVALKLYYLYEAHGPDDPRRWVEAKFLSQQGVLTSAIRAVSTPSVSASRVPATSQIRLCKWVMEAQRKEMATRVGCLARVELPCRLSVPDRTDGDRAQGEPEGNQDGSDNRDRPRG